MGFGSSGLCRANCSASAPVICLKANLAALICNTSTHFVAAYPNYKDPSGDAKWKTMEETRIISTASQLYRSSSGMPWLSGCYNPTCQWPLPCWVKRYFFMSREGAVSGLHMGMFFLKGQRQAAIKESPVHTEILKRPSRKTMSVLFLQFYIQPIKTIGPTFWLSQQHGR